MDSIPLRPNSHKETFYRWANALALITIFYNLIEGIVSVFIGYELTGIGMLDSLGAVGIAVLSFKEGREAFEKTKGNFTCTCQNSCR